MNSSEHDITDANMRTVGDDNTDVQDYSVLYKNIRPRRKRQNVKRSLDCGTGECLKCRCSYDNWIDKAK